MKVYLVGGAVRDRLLDREYTDADWLVTGATPEQMTAQGYTKVGGHFPVFLHPETKEEYALARTEKKDGIGYGGFAFEFSPETSVEEDLQRRDLTINAIAQDPVTLTLIDPYNGQDDIDNRTLRHVSDAFVEDPLRLYRAARFYAELDPWQFQVSLCTRQLLQSISRTGELSAIPPQRVWRETFRAMKTSAPHKYFELLLDSHASAHLFTLFESNTTERLAQLKRLGQRQDWLSQTQASTELLMCLWFLPTDNLGAALDFYQPFNVKKSYVTWVKCLQKCMELVCDPFAQTLSQKPALLLEIMRMLRYQHDPATLWDCFMAVLATQLEAITYRQAQSQCDILAQIANETAMTTKATAATQLQRDDSQPFSSGDYHKIELEMLTKALDKYL